MAGASLLALLDDITTILDDVSLMTKVAAKKCWRAGRRPCPECPTGCRVRDRELPVVWAVAKVPSSTS